MNSCQSSCQLLFFAFALCPSPLSTRAAPVATGCVRRRRRSRGESFACDAELSTVLLHRCCCKKATHRRGHLRPRQVAASKDLDGVWSSCSRRLQKRAASTATFLRENLVSAPCQWPPHQHQHTDMTKKKPCLGRYLYACRQPCRPAK